MEPKEAFHRALIESERMKVLILILILTLTNLVAAARLDSLRDILVRDHSWKIL
jgi:hypothetical protein